MPDMSYPPQPTADQCTDHARLPDRNGLRCWAIWYPQMGGYIARCVIVDEGGCFGAFVWHDGEFPFSDESPAYLHHCDPEQFIDFGEAVVEMLGVVPEVPVPDDRLDQIIEEVLHICHQRFPPGTGIPGTLEAKYEALRRVIRARP